MKKTYISPALIAIKLDSKTCMCVNSLPIKTEDPGGSEQLSKKFWGAAPWETREEAAEEDDTLY